MWDSRAGVTILAPREQQRMLERQVDSAGLRLLRSATLDEARERPVVGAGVVLLDLSVDDARNDGLLDELDRASAEGHLSLLVRTAITSLDPVSARVECRRTMILCDPSVDDLIASLRAAADTGKVPCAFFDSKRNPPDETEENDEFEAELDRIIDAVELRVEPMVRDAPATMGPGDLDASELAAQIHAILRVRRTRNEQFNDELFADPHWDMLLEVFEARLRGTYLSITGLCATAGVPMTTALRCLNVLVKKGLIARKRDQVDRRRVYVDITDVAADALLAWFAKARAQSSLAGL